MAKKHQIRKIPMRMAPTNRKYTNAGISRIEAKSQPVDKNKKRLARKVVGVGGFGSKTAGMYNTPDVWFGSGESYSSAYRTSYANSGQAAGAFGDVPLYFALMNENNGGILYWPVTLKEKYSWYRYFCRVDAYVGQAVDLHVELPMSKILLKMPEMKDEKRRTQILSKYENMCRNLKLFHNLQAILREYYVIGNCFPANHRLHTDKGMIPICEIRSGDLVLTHTGRYEKVLNTQRRWVNERLVSIQLAKLNGFPITPTKEHPILTLRDNKEVFIKSSNIKKGDYVSIWKPPASVDVNNVNVVLELEEILSAKYDKISKVAKNDKIEYDLNYFTNVNVTDDAKLIKDKFIDFLSGLTKPYECNYQELGKLLKINNWISLRAISSNLKRKKVIFYDVIRLKSGGCKIRFYPTNNIQNNIQQREWNKKLLLHKNDVEIDSDFLYVLGYWFGDGWLWRNKRQRSFSYLSLDICFEKNGKCNQYVETKFQKVFGCHVKIKNGSYCDDSLQHLIFEDSIFCEWWNFHFGDNCKTKKIPEWILNLPKEKLVWLLRGYIDSDGCVSNNTVTISSVNESLMQQVFKIGLKCGLPFNFNTVSTKVKLPNNKEKDYHGYSLTVTNHANIPSVLGDCVKAKNYQTSIKQQKSFYKEHNGNYYFQVCNIDNPHFNGYVYNLEVENDHTYCVENINTHNCFSFLEWDESKKEWKKMTILPPEEVNVQNIPFSDHSRIEYKPEELITIIKKITDNISDFETHDDLKVLFPDESEWLIIKHIPIDIIKHIRDNGTIVMDTDPFTGDGDSGIGSFVYHLARNKTPYFDLGVSLIERVLIPLLMKEHYKYTQLSLASRNMTPRNKISADNINPQELDELREQIDLSMMDPDYSIVTNYTWEWDLIGADNRLIDLQREYETIESQLFAGLGVTRELLTGEGMYSGSRITVEILNTRYMLMRDVMTDMVEDGIFRPVAEANGFYDVDELGNKTYYYPKLSFTRLSIRDNAEVFDNLFQLYQKGSIPVDVILELYNIDTNEITRKLKEDLFTIKDSTYNDFIREIYSNVGQSVVDNSNISELLTQDLVGPNGEKIEFSSQKEEDNEGGDDNNEWNNDTEDNNTEDAGNLDENQWEENNEQEQTDNDDEQEQIENDVDLSFKSHKDDESDISNNKNMSDISNAVPDNADLDDVKKALDNIKITMSDKNQINSITDTIVKLLQNNNNVDSKNIKEVLDNINISFSGSNKNNDALNPTALIVKVLKNHLPDNSTLDDVKLLLTNMKL